MADRILPPHHFAVADDIEYQVSSLGAGLRMLRDELAMPHNDPERVAEAVDRLYFISDGIEAVRARLERIAASARQGGAITADL